MKVGLDIHGVIDRYPEELMWLSNNLITNGHEVHIITGQEWEKAESTVNKARIAYSHHFSIVDHHKSIGTKMWKDNKGTWWMDEITWLRSKGDYIYSNKIDVHFDDSYEYANWIPDACTFILVPKEGLDRFLKLCFNMF